MVAGDGDEGSATAWHARGLAWPLVRFEHASVVVLPLMEENAPAASVGEVCFTTVSHHAACWRGAPMAVRGTNGLYLDEESGEIRDLGDERRLSTARDLLLRGVNGNSLRLKRFVQLVNRLAVDQGGIAGLSEVRLALLRRFAASCVMAEQLEVDFFKGKEIDMNLHVGMSSILARLSARIGIDRRAKHVVPNLTDYLELPVNEEREEATHANN